jgi:hypothetical protein
VAALVYIAAFDPDQGQSVSTLPADPPPGTPMPPILLSPTDSYCWIAGVRSTCPPGRRQIA